MENDIELGIALALVILFAAFAVTLAREFTERSMANSEEPVLTSVKAFFWALVAAAVVDAFLFYQVPKEYRLSVVIGVALAFVLMEWAALRRGRRIRRGIDYYAGCLRSEQPVYERRVGARGLNVQSWAARRARAALTAASEHDEDEAVRWLAHDALDRIAYGFESAAPEASLAGKESIESRMAEISRFLRKYLPMVLFFVVFLAIWVLTIVKFGVMGFFFGGLVSFALMVPVVAVWAVISKLRQRNQPAQTPPKGT